MKEEPNVPKKSETDTSESVWESDVDDARGQERDLRSWIVYYIDMWKCYWRKRFFRQIVRSSILFIIGMKLLREIKGLNIIPLPVCPDPVPDEITC